MLEAWQATRLGRRLAPPTNSPLSPAAKFQSSAAHAITSASARAEKRRRSVPTVCYRDLPDSQRLQYMGTATALYYSHATSAMLQSEMYRWKIERRGHPTTLNREIRPHVVEGLRSCAFRTFGQELAPPDPIAWLSR